METPENENSNTQKSDMTVPIGAKGTVIGTEKIKPVDWSQEGKLFAKRAKVFPKRVKGFYRSAKWAMMAVLLGIYYLTPWLRWDRGPFMPDQGVLVDLPGRRFYFFMVEIWPNEVYYITGLLLLAAIGLFLITAVWGRMWCAWGCPQTVWTDLYMLVERKVEGDRNARMKLDAAKWTFDKIWKRVLKHSIWILIAMGTGGAWVFYFMDAPTLAAQLAMGTAPYEAYITIAFLTFTTYLMAGHAREQVCTYACPYARFQSVMIDKDSCIITYKADRGEKRGKAKRGASFEGRGHCIDCTQCVAVCPMGIDIRKGMQIECINCGLCADACDHVMDLMNLPHGLIGHDSEANVERRSQGLPNKRVLWRPRTVIYSVIMVAAASLMLFTLIMRPVVDSAVQRDRNPVFVLLSNGDIRNGFTLKVMNKLYQHRTYQLSVEGLDDATITVVGVHADEEGRWLVTVNPDDIGHFRVLVSTHKASLEGSNTPFGIRIVDVENGNTVLQSTAFKGPNAS